MQLLNGATFPSISAPVVGGGSMTIPDDFNKGWAVVIFYRGLW